MLSENPDMDIGGGQTPIRVFLALIDGNFAEAERVLAASPREDFQDIDYSFYYPKAWFEAMIARAKAIPRVRPLPSPPRAQSWSRDWPLSRNTHERLPSSLRWTPVSAAKNWRFKKRNTPSI